MHPYPLFPRQDDSNCISLAGCSDPLPCSCAANEDCVRINRNCTTCPFNQCIPRAAPAQAKGGVSKGAVAGSIIGVAIFFAIVIFLFLHHRKRTLVRRNRSSVREVKKDIPAPAETVLNRPDPTEKSVSERDTVRVYSTRSSTTIDLDPHSNTSHPPDGFISNPFEDASSIQTAGTEATNVIQIAFVPPGSNRGSLSQSETNSAASSSLPVRPARSPELNLNLDHVNVSHDNLRSTNGYNHSTISGISGISSRNSYMSSASYSSDFLNEAPMIMTPTKGVRQVVGVVKAEVISAGSLNSANNSSDSLKPPPAYSKPVVKSPLAATSFGPNDMLREEREESEESHETTDPFADKHISTQAEYATSADPSNLTFKHLSTQEESAGTEWDLTIPKQPWSRSTNERPSSMSTQAGSVIDIASATRVNVGLKTPASANSYRTTMGRLVTPPSNHPGTLQEQQQRALAHAQAQAQAQGLDRRRISNSSVLSATSTRADSILESFPFVPPSPISDRPIRSPPASPLAQQSFTNGSTSPLHKHTFVVAPPSPLNTQSFTAEPNKMAFMSKDPLADSLPAPPDRRALLGLSTGSQLSTASSG
ncbi:hypothetical protein BJ912DRAFT_1057812 [Pholiota molesta]|nr:hypothetical protein BJ912DRAFT_1057812 [Pholiota molesta]